MSAEVVDARDDLGAGRVPRPPRIRIAGRRLAANVLDLGAVPLDLCSAEHRLDVQKPGGREEVTHFLEVIAGPEPSVEIQRDTTAVHQRRQYARAVDLATGRQRLDRRLPPLPSLQVSSREASAPRAYSARGRQQILQELRKGLS